MGERGLAVEPAVLAARFAVVLHDAGVPVGPDRAARFASALRLVAPQTRDRLYWTARTTLLGDVGQVPAFDVVFGRIFGDDAPSVDLAERRGDPTAPPLPNVPSEMRPALPDNRPAERAPSGVGATTGSAADGAAGEPRAVPALASSAERLHHATFAELTDDEVDAVRRLVRRVVLATPRRKTRRTRASTKGERIDVRRTVRDARKTGGDPVALIHRRRRRRPRPLVLLCDVSGSMEPYTRVFLALLHGSVSGARAEAFVFATRLTRLTRPLARHNPDLALRRAAESAPDWAGGTRLADALHRFLDDHGRRGLARGAVVVILSDGWAQDEPSEVAAQMARLSRLAHRIVWVNPRKAAPGFAPKVGGMAAALPYCDAFVSGHSLAALSEVAAAVGSPGRRLRKGQNLQKGLL